MHSITMADRNKGMARKTVQSGVKSELHEYSHKKIVSTMKSVGNKVN